MPTVVLDTDFLSSFLKIGRCDLVRVLYQVEQVVIPTAVHRELARTDLLALLVDIPWINTVRVEMPSDQAVHGAELSALGAGEQASIMLAYSLPDALLLMSDNRARRFARSLGIAVINVPAFLLACKTAELVDREEVVEIIEDLKAKDFYSFTQEVQKLLLD